MTALIRTAMQLGIARVLATPIGLAAFEFLEPLGMTAERLADYATVIVLGAGVALARALKSHPIGARLVEWVNLILSWGRTVAGPEYQPKHLAA